MSKPVVQCRCGHHVIGREILRAEPYERASGEEVVYVKYRCRNCKHLGEEFVPRLEWSPTILETPRDEMTYPERDKFSETSAVSSGDVISFHRLLNKTQTVADLARGEVRRKEKKNDKNRSKETPKDGDQTSGTSSPSGRSGQ